MLYIKSLEIRTMNKKVKNRREGGVGEGNFVFSRATPLFRMSIGHSSIPVKSIDMSFIFYTNSLEGVPEQRKRHLLT